MDEFCSKLVRWDDGIGRSALDVQTHLDLQIWNIFFRNTKMSLRSSNLAAKVGIPPIRFGAIFCMAGEPLRKKSHLQQALSEFKQDRVTSLRTYKILTY